MDPVEETDEKAELLYNAGAGDTRVAGVGAVEGWLKKLLAENPSGGYGVRNNLVKRWMSVFNILTSAPKYTCEGNNSQATQSVDWSRRSDPCASRTGARQRGDQSL